MIFHGERHGSGGELWLYNGFWPAICAGSFRVSSTIPLTHSSHPFIECCQTGQKFFKYSPLYIDWNDKRTKTNKYRTHTHTLYIKSNC